MSTIKIESDKKYILIALEEYEELKKFKNNFPENFIKDDDIYLKDEELKEIDRLKEKARNDDLSDFTSLEDLKNEILKKSR
jgi:hypothetical protein